jgi:hypothetical protein
VHAAGPLVVDSVSVLEGLVEMSSDVTIDGNLSLPGVNTVTLAYGDLNVGGNLNVTGSCGSCSDERLKKNVAPLTGALERLMQLKGVTFEWIDPSLHKNEAGHGEGTQTGFIAQDVEKLFPNWVKDDGFIAKDGQKYRTLELRQIEALEVESIRELKAENDDLREKLGTSQARLARLEARLDALEGAGDSIVAEAGQRAARAKTMGTSASKLR